MNSKVTLKEQQLNDTEYLKKIEEKVKQHKDYKIFNYPPYRTLRNY